MMKVNKKNSSKSFGKTQDLRPTFKEEKKLWKLGYKYIIGVDEVGRGAFAGPVTVAAVIFPSSLQGYSLSKLTRSILVEVNDSKMLSPKKREELSPLIKKHSIYSISTVSVRIINKVGIGKATEIAFRRSISSIMKKVLSIDKNSEFLIHNSRFFLLVDGFHIKYVKGIGLKNQKAIVKGDKKSLSIAAASIIAKVYRDNIMIKLSKLYPEYDFDLHKGYGTKLHRDNILENGVTNLHRTAFCNSFLKNTMHYHED